MRYLYLCFVLLFCGCQEGSLRLSDATLDKSIANEVVQANGMKSPKSTVGNGLYYGISDNRFGRLTWLLEFRNDEAVLYMPPNNLTIRNITSKVDGHISFETDHGIGGQYYKFTGRVVNDRVEGEFELINANTPMSVRTTLRRIDSSSLEKQEFSGLFSNAEFVDEGGDLVGSELIVIPVFGDLMGIYTSYENEMTPYATKITRTGDKIKFDILTEEGVQTFEGTFSSNEIRLNYVGKDSNPDVEQMVLFKKQELDNLFRN